MAMPHLATGISDQLVRVLAADEINLGFRNPRFALCSDDVSRSWLEVNSPYFVSFTGSDLSSGQHGNETPHVSQQTHPQGAYQTIRDFIDGARQRELMPRHDQICPLPP